MHSLTFETQLISFYRRIFNDTFFKISLVLAALIFTLCITLLIETGVISLLVFLFPFLLIIPLISIVFFITSYNKRFI